MHARVRSALSRSAHHSRLRSHASPNSRSRCRHSSTLVLARARRRSSISRSFSADSLGRPGIAGIPGSSPRCHASKTAFGMPALSAASVEPAGLSPAGAEAARERSPSEGMPTPGGPRRGFDSSSNRLSSSSRWPHRWVAACSCAGTHANGARSRLRDPEQGVREAQRGRMALGSTWRHGWIQDAPRPSALP